MKNSTLINYWSTLPEDRLDAEFENARRSVRAFEAVTLSSGSLIQDWLRGERPVEYEHYPPDDVVDLASGSQYYYHSHRGAAEHGHVHLFWHARSDGRRYVARGDSRKWVECSPTHLIGISIDSMGVPVGLFTVNKWVTDGYWFDAVKTMKLFDRFSMESVDDYRDSSVWLNCFVRMYRPVIFELLRKRDAAVSELGESRDVLECRDHEMLSHIEVDWTADLDALEAIRLPKLAA